MNTATTLQDIQYAASICLKCGSCTYGDWPENHHLCSLYYRDECFTHGGGGFMSIVTGLAEDRMPLDQRVADLAYTCSGCLACDSRCSIIKAHPPQADMMDMIRLLRYEAVRKGMMPATVKRPVRAPESTVDSPHDVERYGAYAHPEDMAIFVEYGINQSGSAAQDALFSLLGKMKRSVSLFREEKSCASSLYDYGQWDDLIPVMKTNWEKMKRLEGKEVIFTNPHCEEFLSKRYEENLDDFAPIRHRHFSQILADALRDGTLRSKNGQKVRVTYHDPCYLGRGLGVYDAPREALTALEGVELVEMVRNRKSAFCCGAGAIGNYFPDHSGEMARERLAEFEATGADLLITACPHCRENLRKAAAEGRKEGIRDLAEFVNERT